MTKRMADGLKTALQQALQMETNHDWVEIWNDSIEELKPTPKPTIPPDFYGSDEIRKLGIKCGENCLLAKTTTVVAPEKLVLGNNVRIDGYSVISCGIGIVIGDYVHLASHLVLMGGAGINIENYASVASGAKIFSVSDDVMGRGLVGPTVPMEKRHLHSGKVILRPHSVMAVSSIIMPGSVLSTGSTLMPFSLLNNARNIAYRKYAILSGVPAVVLKDKVDGFKKLVEETENE